MGFNDQHGQSVNVHVNAICCSYSPEAATNAVVGGRGVRWQWWGAAGYFANYLFQSPCRLTEVLSVTFKHAQMFASDNNNNCLNGHKSLLGQLFF